MPGLSAADVELVVVDYRRMSSAAARNCAVQLRLSPMRRLEVEYYYVREMLAMFVLSTKDQ